MRGVLLLLTIGCAAPPDIAAPVDLPDASTTDDPAEDAADVPLRPQTSRPAGDGAFAFTFNHSRELQGYTDCTVDYALRWVHEPAPSCEGCEHEGLVEVDVRADDCEWHDWTTELEAAPHHYGVDADAGVLWFFGEEGAVDMRDLGWEVAFDGHSAHLVGWTSDGSYEVTEERRLTWGDAP